MQQGSKDKITWNQFKNNFELNDGFMVEALPSLSYLIKTYRTVAPKWCCSAVMSRSKQHIWNTCVNPVCDLVSCSPPSQTGTRNWGSLLSQFWERDQIQPHTPRVCWPTTKGQSTWKDYFSTTPEHHKEGCVRKSDSRVVCRLQKYIPKYTPFQKPTQSKATVPPAYLPSQLFLLNTCLRKTERTH